MSQRPVPNAPGPPSSSDRKLMLMLGSCLGVGLLLTLCAATITIGGMALFRQRLSAVQSQIASDPSMYSINSFAVSSADAVDAEQALPIRTAGRIGTIEIQVMRSTTESGNSSSQPALGNEFRVIDVSALNRGTQSVDIYGTLTSSWVQAGSARGYRCCRFERMPDPIGSTMLEPGAWQQIRLVFEVPRDVDPLLWVLADPQSHHAAAPLVVKLR